MLQSWKERQQHCCAKLLILSPQLLGGATTFPFTMAINTKYIKRGKSIYCLFMMWIDPRDTGTYSCDTGDVQSSAKLTVTGKSVGLY